MYVQVLTLERDLQKFLIFTTSSAEKYGVTSLLICFTWQAIIMVLNVKSNTKGTKGCCPDTSYTFILQLYWIQ